MRHARFALFVLLFALPVAAQDRSTASPNPLPALMAELTHVLEDAGVPFTVEQQRAIVLMMEDRRQASEDLFRDLMDFSAGPTAGRDVERLQSAIAWIRDDFVNRLPEYLTALQLAAWTRHEAARTAAAGRVSDTRQATDATRTQFVRINNNPFTAEFVDYRTRAQNATEVIQRGGTGGWHG